MTDHSYLYRGPSFVGAKLPVAARIGYIAQRVADIQQYCLLSMLQKVAVQISHGHYQPLLCVAVNLLITNQCDGRN